MTVLQVLPVLQDPGLTSGTSGATGPQGDAGSSGTSGATGDAGSSGTSGDPGTSGTSGTGGAGGGAALIVRDGSTTVTDVEDIVFSGGTVTSGTSGIAQVTISGGGGGGISTVLSPTVRYQAYESGLIASQILSTGTLYAGLSWSQSGTTVTVTSTSHGLSTGDYIVVRGGADSYLYVDITSTGANTFTYTSATSATTTGTDGAYVPAFKLTTVSKTGATIIAPGAGDCQLLSMTFQTGGALSQTYVEFVMPADIENGAGGNTDLQDKNIPSVGIVINGTTNSGGSVSFSTTGTFNTFRVEGLNGALNNFVKMAF